MSTSEPGDPPASDSADVWPRPRPGGPVSPVTPEPTRSLGPAPRWRSCRDSKVATSTLGERPAMPCKACRAEQARWATPGRSVPADPGPLFRGSGAFFRSPAKERRRKSLIVRAISNGQVSTTSHQQLEVQFLYASLLPTSSSLSAVAKWTPQPPKFGTPT